MRASTVLYVLSAIIPVSILYTSAQAGESPAAGIGVWVFISVVFLIYRHAIAQHRARRERDVQRIVDASRRD